MPKGSGGGGRPGRSGGGGGGTPVDAEAEMGARMDAAYNRLSKRIDEMESRQYKLNKEDSHTNSKRRRREIDQEIRDLAKKKNVLIKQRTKVYEANPLTKKRENERLDYALTR